MYGQSNQSDSQPEWRLPPRRPVGQPPEPGRPPPPPRPPNSPASYSPAMYGPISTPNPSVSPDPAPNTDPRTWGVRYNQHQIYAPPPLPPRPSSTNEQPYAYTQSQAQSPPQPLLLNTNFAPSATNHGPEAFADIQPPSAASIPPPYFPQHAAVPVPAPPPKIPQDHQAPVQQNNPPLRPLVSVSSRPPPASALNDIAPPSASALGPGTPSDWEHFGPTPGDFDDTPWFPPRRPEPMPQETAQTPPGFSTGLPNSTTIDHASDRASLAETVQGHYASSAEDTTDYYPHRDSVSPISPGSTSALNPPSPGPARPKSSNSGVSFDDRAESIDNVIDAWVRPLTPANKQTQHGQAASNPAPVQEAATASATATPTTEVRAGLTVPREVDPYEDLDPWSKSSLTRYVAMLRKETVADSDEERFKIFTAFMSKETKLREILYNIEHEAPTPQEPTPAPEPTPPPNSDDAPPPSAEDENPAYESGLIPVESEDITREDTNDNEDTGSEYSAGGRPIVAKQARRGSHWLPKLSTLPQGDTSAQLARSPSAPYSADDRAQKQVLEPLETNPPRPIYTPFQYTEGPQRGSDNLTFDRPAYQAYSDLRQASAVSGRVMSNAPLPTSRSRSTSIATSPVHNEHDETFLGVIRHRSTAYQAINRRNTTPLPLLPEALRKGRSDSVVEDLRALVWTPLDKHSESSWHVTTRGDLEKFPDDFTYIQEIIDDWEQTAKARRDELDQERSARQEDSEERIDELFNEKEIGYADIHTLEEDFRQTEARVQLEEERLEVEDFINRVFNPLDERLKEEISALRKSYDSALNQLDRDQKGKNSPVEQCSPAVTMKMVNEIHSKLEIRFQKRLEIALDCERRRKKAERRPLVFMGDTAGLRKLDGDFDRMEKRNILEAARDRDDRANRLMDSFDDAILHGLGMNQSLLDELSSKAARLDPSTLRASGLPDSEVEQILKSAATFVASLRADSEEILRSSGVADMTLNEADYNVSVAEARYANSEADVFQRLESEKQKEDAVLQKDLEDKLQSIQRSPSEIDAMVQRALEDLGQVPAPAPPAPETEAADPADQALAVPPLELRPATATPASIPTAAPERVPDADAEHQERLRKALENAKKRNAARHHQ
ncbi:hypothetical protein N7512_004136 [Penicillium capsulatum]|nr:hypothetical protein N7512_004136 [Penicillium capsulatum]